MYPEVLLHIDGAWTGAQSGKTIPVMNPATGEQNGTVAHAERADLDRALEAAERGFQHWRKVSAFERYKVLRKAAELLRQRADAIAPIMTMEQGKPVGEARMEADSVTLQARAGRYLTLPSCSSLLAASPPAGKVWQTS